MISLLTSYRNYILGGIVLLALVFVIYQIKNFIRQQQKIGYDKAVAEYTSKALEVEKAARIRENTLNVKLQEAQNAATKRDIKIRELSNTLNVTSGKLRDTIAALQRDLPGSSSNARLESAVTGLAIFGECAQEYVTLAEKADRHASDVRKLLDSHE